MSLLDTIMDIWRPIHICLIFSKKTNWMVIKIVFAGKVDYRITILLIKSLSDLL